MSETNTPIPNNKKGHSDKIFVDVVDIMNITGKSKPTSYRTIARIKDYFNKKEHQPVTIKEMNEYFGII